MPKKPSVSAIPVNTPSTEASSDEPASESQSREEVLNEINAEPQQKSELKRSKTEEPGLKPETTDGEKPQEVKQREEKQTSRELRGQNMSSAKMKHTHHNDCSARPKAEGDTALQPEVQPKPEETKKPEKEKVSCEHCGKSVSAKTLNYNHSHNCKSRPKAEGDSEPPPPRDETTSDIIYKRMAAAREAKARLREERLKNLTVNAF